MNILVTGGRGFIGHHVVHRLCEQGHCVTVLDSGTDYGFIPNSELLYLSTERLYHITSQKNVPWTINIDIRFGGDIRELFNRVSPTVVIHLASFPRQKVVEKSPSIASEVMSTGLINLLETSKISKIDRFVYVSSSMVYGDFTDGVKEDTICNPIGQYGIMKYMGEQLTRDYSRRKCFDHVIVRPSAVYGERDVEDRVVSKFLLAALRGETLNVYGASEELDFTHVDDIAQGIVLAATSTNAANKTYNMTRSKAHTLWAAAELATIIAKNGGKINIHDKNLSFPSRGRLDITAAQNDLGFNPNIDIEEGFTRYANWLTNSKYWNTRI